MAVHLRRAFAPAVAEQAVVLLAEPAHVGSLGVGREATAVEVVDAGGDVEVLLGHGAIRDAGVDEGHLQVLVPSRAATASKRMPRLMAWVATV
ncbi:MAG TPA: hypothetical protein VGR26_02800 [Acidimicrobiales bacterium]|nr:hypothetical protein [Acidimicrobiales bacterium]